jgi:hypothetical protein
MTSHFWWQENWYYGQSEKILLRKCYQWLTRQETISGLGVLENWLSFWLWATVLWGCSVWQSYLLTVETQVCRERCYGPKSYNSTLTTQWNITSFSTQKQSNSNQHTKQWHSSRHTKQSYSNQHTKQLHSNQHTKQSHSNQHTKQSHANQHTVTFQSVLLQHLSIDLKYSAVVIQMTKGNVQPINWQ